MHTIYKYIYKTYYITYMHYALYIDAHKSALKLFGYNKKFKIEIFLKFVLKQVVLKHIYVD